MRKKLIMQEKTRRDSPQILAVKVVQRKVNLDYGLEDCDRLLVHKAIKHT